MEHRDPDIKPFVPLDSEPAEAIKELYVRPRNIPIRIRVLKTQDKLATVMARKQEVKQCCAYTANM
ncbi:hypothetical protein GCM10025858_15770 [Alicyclobacillus sacchari]|nr:hypothetical protein GCM10025858_15770 [Alicyclobacillus sacchari]